MRNHTKQWILVALLLATAGACAAPNAEERARAAAADIEASIQDYDGPALNQKVDRAVVIEVQTNLTKLNEYMGEINGEIDPVLVNSIQAFQRRKSDDIPWWRSWQRLPNDGLIVDSLRQEIAAAVTP